MVKMKTIMTTFGVLAAASVALMPEMAHATSTGFAGMATQIKGQAKSMTDLLDAAAYLGGGGLGLMSLFKFKQHSENPQQVKLSEPIVMALVSGGLLTVPTFMNSGKETMYGQSTTNWSSVLK